MTNPLARLPDFGQSVWYDFIRRDLVQDGTLDRYILEDKLAGMTSNPAIFKDAIAKSDLYDEDIRAADSALDAETLFERIAVAEIQAAADRFQPVFEATKGRDGYVSLEVSPILAHDTEGTTKEARRLWEACDRQNVMIKIPGTVEGLPAIETCLAEGINVNVTLLFGVERYRAVMDAWMRGLERRVEAGHPIDTIASVASFFVSRVDSLVDATIEGHPSQDALAPFKNKLGIANARVAYQAWEEMVRDAPRFAALKEHGAMVQRPLWASTSTKDPALPNDYYMEALIGPDTVNTVPPKTYEDYRENGDPANRIEEDLDGARAALDALATAGIDFEALTMRLEVEGVKKFADAYEALLTSITAKREQIKAN